jgi:hypothetical protein
MIINPKCVGSSTNILMRIVLRWFYYPIRLSESFPEVMQPGPEVDHSPPSRADFKNVWSRTSTVSVYLQGMNGHNFTFYCLV